MLKEEAKKKKLPSQILATIGYGDYFILDSYEEFMLLINKKKKSYCEYTPDNVPLNMFYDLDASESPGGKYSESEKKIIVNAFKNPESIAQEVISKTRDFFENLNISCKFMVLSSHGWSEEKKVNKMSYHIIVKLHGSDGKKVFVRNMEVAKAIAESLFPDWIRLGIVDEKVYKGERVFRTIGSSKPNEKRALEKCLTLSSDGTTDMDSFICYGPMTSESIILDLCDLGLNCLTTVVGPKAKKQKKQHSSSSSASSITTEVTQLLDRLETKFYTERNYWLQICHILECIGATIDVWLAFSSKWENYNEKEATSTWNSIKRKHETDNPGHTIADLRKLLSKSLMNEVTIANGGKEFISLSNDSFMDQVKEFDYDKLNNSYKCSVGDNTRDFFFKNIACVNSATNHTALHFARNNEFGMECQSCGCVHGPFNIPAKYTHLTVIFNQQITNITNNYNGISRAPAFVHIDENVFNDETLTNSMNEILSGHVIVASEFLKEKVSGFVYCKDKKPIFYHFTGVIWEEDVDNMHLRARLRSLKDYFTQILSFYTNLPKTESNQVILDAARKQSLKFSDIHHLNKIIEGSQDFYYVQKFTDRLDSNKRLLAFNNGVYDLENNVFREANMDDYLSITVGYSYEPEVETAFMFEFLKKILPEQHLLDYMLKRLSDCLDGSIPNTIFLIICGDGANGKSQLFNLMQETMGEGYGRKIASSLLTRKRENANDTNSEMIDMKGKRFIYFSEPEGNQKFNISNLKDLTGSEKIKATAKYEGSSSFTIDAKMFLGCNEIPELKAEDKAIWRRVRLIEFKSNFVHNPNPGIAHQYLVDDKLPDKIRTDFTWRQALMKILLQYYYRQDVLEPEEVRRQTEELRDDNNEAEKWCIENIERDPEFETKQLVVPKAHSHWIVKEEVKRALSMKKDRDVDRIIRPYIQKYLPGIDPDYKQHNFISPSGLKKTSFRCWLGIRLKTPDNV